MLILNLLIFIISMWLIIMLNNNYLQQAMKNKSRFKLYKLRDELSLLAMRGELEEQSEEYLTLLGLINSSIRATGTFKVTDFLRFVFRMHKDKELHRKIERIKENLRKTDNPAYCKIASNYFNTMHNILQEDTRILRLVFLPTLLFLTAIIALLKLSTKPRSAVESKRTLMQKMDDELGGYSNQFHSMCST